MIYKDPKALDLAPHVCQHKESGVCLDCSAPTTARMLNYRKFDSIKFSVPKLHQPKQVN